jgi:hypothetical protein
MLELISSHPKVFNGIIKRKNNKGYIYIKIGEGWIEEHRLVCETILKRILTKEEVVHHINFCRSDNSPENLALFESQQAHSHWHSQFNQFGSTQPLLAALNKRRLICHLKMVANI